MDDTTGHRYFEGLAVAHVLGGLDDSEGRVFRSHLLECGSCRARVGELRAIAHDLADVERDERRVRAAKAIDTKRRETEEELDETAEPPAAPRSSRMTVIVGLVLIIGLSLWNFTLRGALTVQEQLVDNLQDAGVIADSGAEWTAVFEATGVEGSIKSKDSSLLVTLDGLKTGSIYGIYTLTSSGAVTASHVIPVTEGTRIFRLFDLSESVEKVTITAPSDQNGNPTRPGPDPTGQKVFEATRP